jgi:hypothetical protein
MMTAFSFKVYSARKICRIMQMSAKYNYLVCADVTAVYSQYKYTNAYQNKKTKQKIRKITKEL